MFLAEKADESFLDLLMPIRVSTIEEIIRNDMLNLVILFKDGSIMSIEGDDCSIHRFKNEAHLFRYTRMSLDRGKCDEHIERVIKENDPNVILVRTFNL